MKTFIFMHFFLDARLGNTAGEQRSPNVTRRKRVLQTFDIAPFWRRFGNAAGDALRRYSGVLVSLKCPL
jgi:hypothetical protein